MAGPLHHSSVGLSEKKRIELIAMLNKTLAGLTDLYAQTKQAHWNVKGPTFYALHLLFDAIAEEVEGQVDIVAERITALGGTALGTLQEAVKLTPLRLYPADISAAKDHLEHLAHNYAILSELASDHAREAEKLDDLATSDVYIALTRLLDKNLWFIESHFQK